MAANKYQRIAPLLFELEDQLRLLQLWQETQPSAEAFSSDLPFSHDTMEFPQWLQFIFLQRMHTLLKHSMALPKACAIAPYAEEYFKSLNANKQTLLSLLAEIDKILTEI